MADMSFLQLCAVRRSCRKYDSRPVEREVVARCIEASRLAPSACNSQPWYFIVVDTPEIKEKVAQAAFSGIYSMNAFAKNAPVLVLVVREKPKYAAQLAGALRKVDYSLIDMGITGEHFVLQAASEGLATCWLGWFDDKKVLKMLGLPSSTRVDAIISLGYPAGEAFPGVARKSWDEICEFR